MGMGVKRIKIFLMINIYILISRFDFMQNLMIRK